MYYIQKNNVYINIKTVSLENVNKFSSMKKLDAKQFQSFRTVVPNLGLVSQLGSPAYVPKLGPKPRFQTWVPNLGPKPVSQLDS